MKVYFIGIGGIGISALAQYYLSEGHKIFGSDLASSETTKSLEKMGAKIFIGQNSAENLAEDIDMVIYSPAVQPDNPELKKARMFQVSGSKFQVLSYPEALGELTKKYFTIAVSGAHGKSTTTALASLVMIEAGLDPTVIVGTKLREFGNTNFRKGKSKYLVIEADEFSFSFLNYWPKIIILTNIDEEHLDCYKDLNHILKTFEEYVGHLPKDGVLIANEDDKNSAKMLNPKFQFPNPKQIPNSKFQIQNYSTKNQKEAEKIREVIKIPGKHNISNALAVLVLANVLGIKEEAFYKAIGEYRGAWRRFEINEADLAGKNFILINDYGHHPTEVLATLVSAREKFPDRKIWCVFQPHQYQRTFYLFEKFVKVVSDALLKNLVDEFIIADIYEVAGREKEDLKKKVSSEKIIEAVKNKKAKYLPKNKIKDYLEKNLAGGEAVIFMGAGDIYDLAISILKK